MVITDVIIMVGATLTVHLFDGADNTPAAAEKYVSGTFSAGAVIHFNTHCECAAGSYPKIKTSGAGQVDCQIRGYLRG